ncbi:MAG: hypothetical protein A2Z29_11345 [Chloroflexi bacterium RBG_16_56_11]|nr:MAG: hypothetical protein A2Z29_11345 [Chloroflexi bacterium RBG_16_56_11]
MKPQEYYTSQSDISDPGEYKYLFVDLPDDIPSLCKILQGLILHMHWAERYGVKLTGDIFKEHKLRSTARQLEKIMERDDSPLSVTRPPERRLVGNCRDFSVLLTAMLRHKGIPARARCGFATYFIPRHYEDHWVCQYWKRDEKRWIMVDAQLDELQRDTIYLKFDTFDIPKGLFLPAGDSWLMCRSGKADPELFGFGDFNGLWFIGGNLIRDLLSLNKVELTYFDDWGLLPAFKQKEFSPGYLEKLDEIAAATKGSNPSAAKVQSLFKNKELATPPGWQP